MDPLKHHIVTLDNCGPVSVFLQVDNTRMQRMETVKLYLKGDLEKQRDGAVFLTVHDVGSSYNCWVDWVMDTSMEEIRKRYSQVY